MTAAAVIAGPVSDQWIERAKKILSEGRALTGAEMQELRDQLYRLHEGTDRLAFATLSALAKELDRTADVRLQNLLAERQAFAQEKLDAHERERPARWAALSQLKRAAVILASEVNNNAIALAVARFVQLVEDDTTARRPPPDNFEPRRGG